MFKIGDRVRVTDNTANEKYYDVGDEGTVDSWMGNLPNPCGAWVLFDNPKKSDGLWYVHYDSMELI